MPHSWPNVWPEFESAQPDFGPSLPGSAEIVALSARFAPTWANINLRAWNLHDARSPTWVPSGGWPPSRAPIAEFGRLWTQVACMDPLVAVLLLRTTPLRHGKREAAGIVEDRHRHAPFCSAGVRMGTASVATRVYGLLGLPRAHRRSLSNVAYARQLPASTHRSDDRTPPRATNRALACAERRTTHKTLHGRPLLVAEAPALVAWLCAAARLPLASGCLEANNTSLSTPLPPPMHGMLLHRPHPPPA